MTSWAQSWLRIQCQEGARNSHMESTVGQPLGSTWEALCRDRVVVSWEGWSPSFTVAYDTLNQPSCQLLKRVLLWSLDNMVQDTKSHPFPQGFCAWVFSYSAV